jgi:hypothetical protein
MSDHGFIPLGKFSRARDSILHFMSISDWAFESFGNVSDYGSYKWYMVNEYPDVAGLNGEINSVLSDWFEANPEVTDSEDLRRELVGNFLITETDQGFVYVQAFDTRQELEKAWREAESAYNAWDEPGPDYLED